MESAMDLLKDPFPPYAKVVEVVAKVRKTSDGALRRRANLIFEPLTGLAGSFAQLNALADAARGLEFGKVEETSIDIPSPDACAVDARVSQARANQESILESLKRIVAQVGYLHKEIEKRMGGGTAPPGLEALENAAVMSKVFACDSLDQPFPNRARPKPAGEYDRVLGIEEFFTFLRMLPDPVDQALPSQWPFPSQLADTQDVMKRIRELNALLNDPANQWLLGGNLAAEMRRLNALVARSDAAVNAMMKKLESSSGRAALMAGGIALKLAEDPKKLTFKEKKLESWLIAELKANRSRLQELNSEYMMAALDRQIQIRDEIIRAGLPGDPSVRQMWVMRSAAREQPR
jgi:hypothetical protein